MDIVVEFLKFLGIDLKKFVLFFVTFLILTISMSFSTFLFLTLSLYARFARL